MCVLLLQKGQPTFALSHQPHRRTVERCTNQGLPTAHGANTLLLPPGQAGVRLILHEANRTLLHKQKNTELALGTTLPSAVSDKHNVIQSRASNGDPTREMRSVMPLWMDGLESWACSHTCKEGNFVLTQAVGTLSKFF